MKINLTRRVMTHWVIILLSILLVLFSTGCNPGVSKAERLEMFISTMKISGSNPRPHFAGSSKAYLIGPTTFENTELDSTDGLSNFSYSISGDTFSMSWDTTSYGTGKTANGTFYAETSGPGGEEWFIKSITVKLLTGASKTIPDEL